MNFLEKYPLKTHEVLHFPLMFPDSMKAYHGPALKYPSMAILYDFAGACGIAKGAVRTALSRMNKDGLVVVHNDNGISRYQAGNLQLEAMMNFQRRSRRIKGFTLAVYSFDSGQSKERTAARELLEYMGFVHFAQNVWMACDVKTEELTKAMAAEGLDNNVYLFDVQKVDRKTMQRIVLFWNLEERAALLQAYYDDVQILLDKPGTDLDSFTGLGIAWVTFIIHIQGTEPPVPAELLPPGYRYDEILKFLQKKSIRYGPAIYRYWKRMN